MDEEQGDVVNGEGETAVEVHSMTHSDATTSSKPKALDGGWGWVVVFGSAMTHFLVVGTGRSFGVYFVILKEKLGTSALATAWIVAIFNTARMFFGPLAGVLCEKFTCRKVVIVGGLITSAGCLISAFGNSLVYFYLTFGLIAGFGASLIFTPSYIIVAQYFDKKKGRAMAGATLGSGLGTLALAPIIALLLETYGFFGAMLVHGSLMLHNCFFGALFRPPPQEKPIYRKRKQTKEPTVTANKEETMLTDEDGKQDTENCGSQPEMNTNGEVVEVKRGKESFMHKFKESFGILKNVVFLLYGLQILGMSVCIQVFLTYLPSLGIEKNGTKAEGAFLLSVVGIADMCGRFCFGFFFDLNTIRERRRLFHTLIGFVIGGLSIVTGFMPTYYSVFALSIAWGLFEGGFHSQRATIVNEFVTKEQMASSVGFVIFFQGFGNVCGPPVAGAIRDATLTYSSCYIFCGVFIVVTSMLFLCDYLIRKPFKR